ncbi:MAG: hypothetical protein HHAS10_01770 [Candidatus Altimarinota bacterium]
MRYQLIILGILLLIIASSASFFIWGGSVPSKYSHGTLTAGVGLEDIHLYASDLFEVMDKVGGGALGVSAGDYGYAYELGYEKFQYVFFFKIPKACRESVGGINELATIKNNRDSFISKYPSCKNIPLSSIFVGPGFRGTNSFGQKIGDELFTGSILGKVDISRQHDFSSGPNVLITESDEWQSLSFESGIRIYYILEKKNERNTLIIRGMTIYKEDDTDENPYIKD